MRKLIPLRKYIWRKLELFELIIATKHVLIKFVSYMITAATWNERVQGKFYPKICNDTTT